jgi:hypothetical protein
MSTETIRTYLEFVGEQLSEERDRKRSLEARGISVITTSGALATLLLGIATFGVQGSFASGWAIALLGCGIGFFATAAIFALRVNQVSNYKEPTAAWMAELFTVEQNTALEHLQGAQRVADKMIRVMRHARVVNDGKAWNLSIAIFIEVGGIISVFGSVLMMLGASAR